MFRRMIAATLVAAGLGLSGTAQAIISHNHNVTSDVIFGSGNANGSFTVDRQNGIELGLRGKLRFDTNNQPQNIFNSNGDGTFIFAAGIAPGGFGFVPNAPTTPVWNFEFSINSNFDGNGANLDNFLYRIGIDFDPGPGQFLLDFDPINQLFVDHAIGTNATGNGGGTVAPSGDTAAYGALIANNNLAQNSWNMEFFNGPPFDVFDPTLDGTYAFFLTAMDQQENELARVNNQIIVGAGASVPETSAMALIGLGLVGLSLTRRHRKA